jgi:hypothetical protein
MGESTQGNGPLAISVNGKRNKRKLQLVNEQRTIVGYREAEYCENGRRSNWWKRDPQGMGLSML